MRVLLRAVATFRAYEVRAWMNELTLNLKPLPFKKSPWPFKALELPGLGGSTTRESTTQVVGCPNKREYESDRKPQNVSPEPKT